MLEHRDTVPELGNSKHLFSNHLELNNLPSEKENNHLQAPHMAAAVTNISGIPGLVLDLR